MLNNFISHSILESNRFGLNVFRTTSSHVELKSLIEEMYLKKADVVIARIPTDKNLFINELISTNQTFFFSEPLVEYSLKTSSASKTPRLLNKDVSIEACESSDLNKINELVKIIFSNYQIHYKDNPFLNPDVIINGYIEWVGNCFKSGKVFIVKKGERVAGFFASTFKDGVAHGGPGGLLPEFEGMGIYWDFHQLVPGKLLESDEIRRIVTSSKASNMAVIKQWDQMGWSISEISHNLHISPMLGREFNKSSSVSSSNFYKSFSIDFPEHQICSLSSIKSFSDNTENGIELSIPFRNYHNNKMCQSFKYTYGGLTQIGMAQLSAN